MMCLRGIWHAMTRCPWEPREFFQRRAGARGHGERGARIYNGGLGAELPAGYRGEAPCQGKLKALKHLCA